MRPIRITTAPWYRFNTKIVHRQMQPHTGQKWKPVASPMPKLIIGLFNVF